jgi:hypothetical protein
MPRQFVRGYDRQAVSRISGSGFSVGRGFGETDEEAEERMGEDRAKEERRRAKMTPEQRKKEDQARRRYANMTTGERVREKVSAPFRRQAKLFSPVAKLFKF